MKDSARSGAEGTPNATPSASRPRHALVVFAPSLSRHVRVTSTARLCHVRVTSRPRLSRHVSVTSASRPRHVRVTSSSCLSLSRPHLSRHIPVTFASRPCHVRAARPAFSVTPRGRAGTAPAAGAPAVAPAAGEPPRRPAAVALRPSCPGGCRSVAAAALQPLRCSSRCTPCGAPGGPPTRFRSESSSHRRLRSGS